MVQLSFECVSAGGSETRAFDAHELVLAGWTGRDASKLQEHIDELAAHGVPGPSTTPMFYRCAVDLVTQTSRLQVLGPDTSGEVEYVLLAMDDGLWVTVGSDQTDRKLEGQIGIAMSKQLAGKVLAHTCWRYDDIIAHWDQIRIKAMAVIDGAESVYQDATLADIKRPEALIAGAPLGGLEDLPVGTVLMSGTPPALGGIRPASRFTMSLDDGVLGRSITRAYDIDDLSVVT
ncbi:MAG: DUF2848 domain-containing protein [Pseudomonadota bacterium]